MSAVAAPRSSTRARPVRRAPARVGVTSALLIVACAAVLIGIVTLQVSVLRLNSERGDLQAKRDQLISSNSELVGRLGGTLRAGRAGCQGREARARARARRDDHHRLAWPVAPARSRRPRGPSGPRRSDRRIRLMLACVCVGIAALAAAHGAGAGARRRGARARRRVAAARHGAAVGAARSHRRPHGPDARALVPGRHRRRVAGADRRSHGLRTGALDVHQDHARHDRAAHGGDARSTCSSRAASTRRPGRASRPIRCSARSSSRGRSSPSRSLGASTPTAAWPPRSSAVDGDGLSGVELSRNDVLSARDGLASVSKVNDRPTGDAALGARAARARARAGQDRAAHARHAHPAARPAGDRGDPGQVAREGGHGRRARHAHGRHPRDGGGAGRAARRATAPAIPRSGACAPSPTSTSRARRSSS